MAASAAAAARRPPRRRRAADLPIISIGALTGGLLASSCCIVQLALNSLSIGCAGFSLLRPYRSLLRLVTAALVALLLARHGASRRTVGTIVASILLTTSEDALTAVNRAGSVRALLQRAGATLRGMSAAPTPRAAVVRWRLAVDGMRCQACAARVRVSVAALPGVRNATVDLGAGHVDVWASASAPVRGEQLAAAVAALDGSYRVALAGAECFTESDQPVACGDGVGGGSGGGGVSGGDGGGALAADLDSSRLPPSSPARAHKQCDDSKPRQPRQPLPVADIVGEL